MQVLEELYYPTPLIDFPSIFIYGVSIGAHAKSNFWTTIFHFSTDPYQIWHTCRARKSATFCSTDFRYRSSSRFLCHFPKFCITGIGCFPMLFFS